jgi:hypothetical protein
MTTVTYHVRDSIHALPDHHFAGIATGLPDAAEIPHVTDYEQWLYTAARLCLDATNPAGITTFAQTDRRIDGHLISKAHILMQAADDANRRVVWHKILLRRDIGAIDLRRPGYIHLLAFTRTARPGAMTPDILPTGPRDYADSITTHAADIMAGAVALAARRIPAPVLCDPFAGRGTIARALAATGIPTEGWDIDPAQIRHATAANPPTLFA